MNSLLLRQQSITHQLRKIYPNVDITKFFDEILVFLNKNPSDSIQIFTSICSDFASFAVLQSFNQSQIMNHSLFIRISHLFRMLLTKATYTCLTKDEEQCLDAISLFATSLCSYKNKIITCFYVNNQDERNFISYERIFFTELFIKKYVRLLTNDICKNSEDKYESYHVKYKVIDRLLASFIQLNDINHSIILDAVLECIKSNIYSELHTKMDFNQSIFTPKQSFFMYHCPKYVCLRHHTHDNESVRKICKSILEFSSDIFQKYLSNEDEEEEKDDEQPRERFEGEDETTKARVTATYVELLNHFALIPKIRVCFIENQIIIDQLIRILELKILRENAKENGRLFNGEVALVSYPIIVLYNLTFEKKISFKLKEKQSVTHVCEKLVKIPNKVIQFASRALAAILKKEDTDEIDSPEEVGRSYLYMIENTLDDLTLTFHGIKLDGVLTNLEDIVQNDQVKEEITNDDEGISLIGQCAYRPDLDVETIQKPALRIIDALSFANEYATEQIKENDLLMEHIRKLADKKEKEKDKEKDERQSIAIRIQWKVEEEAQFISKEVKKINKRQKPVKLEWNETKAVYQYIRGDYRFNLTNSIPTENFDIMISFCRDNQSICDEINQFLTNETSYKISYGEFSPKQMAEKIEHSDIVILCFSSHYQRSYSCRLEGEFANKRSKRIIPINVERGYEPSGWLSTVIKNKDRIELKDFKEKLVQRIAKEYEH